MHLNYEEVNRLCNLFFMPSSPNRRTVNEEFKHFNIYRSTSYFDNVSGMKPYVSGMLDKLLQNSGTNNFKDLYPPVHTELYYAVTMVNGEGQEDKDVDTKKVCALRILCCLPKRSNLRSGPPLPPSLPPPPLFLPREKKQKQNKQTNNNNSNA